MINRNSDIHAALFKPYKLITVFNLEHLNISSIINSNFEDNFINYQHFYKLKDTNFNVFKRHL